MSHASAMMRSPMRVSVVVVDEDEYNAGVDIRRSHIQESET